VAQTIIEVEAKSRNAGTGGEPRHAGIPTPKPGPSVCRRRICRTPSGILTDRSASTGPSNRRNLTYRNMSTILECYSTGSDAR